MGQTGPSQSFNSQIATPMSGAQAGMPDWMQQGQQQWQQQQTQLQQLQQQIQAAQRDLTAQQQASAGQPAAAAATTAAPQSAYQAYTNALFAGGAQGQNASSSPVQMGAGPAGAGTGMGGKTLSPFQSYQIAQSNNGVVT